MMDPVKRFKVRLGGAIGGIASIAAAISELYLRPQEGTPLLWAVVGVVMLFASYYLGKWDQQRHVDNDENGPQP